MRTTNCGLFRALQRRLFLEVTTSHGRVGRAKPVVEGHARTIVGAVERLFDKYLLGENPDRYNPIWRHEDRGVAEW